MDAPDGGASAGDIFERLYDEGMKYHAYRNDLANPKPVHTEQHLMVENPTRLYDEDQKKKVLDAHCHEHHKGVGHGKKKCDTRALDDERLKELARPRPKPQPAKTSPNTPRMKGMSKRLQDLYEDHQAREEKRGKEQAAAEEKKQEEVLQYQKKYDDRRVDPALFDRLHKESAKRNKKKMEDAQTAEAEAKREFEEATIKSKRNPEAFSRLYSDGQKRENVRQFKVVLMEAAEKKSLAATSIHRNVARNSRVFERLYPKPPQDTDSSYYSLTDSFDYLPQ